LFQQIDQHKVSNLSLHTMTKLYQSKAHTYYKISQRTSLSKSENQQTANEIVNKYSYYTQHFENIDAKTCAKFSLLHYQIVC